ncbi:hypothetical protein TNCT_711571 [Trichonephila clavata]|uniref:Uncharacterized protein n=1 Tax=Trichonephila clavata TaxID=2740835 RepID=A0A8X6FQR1_TRICU|nr:hypothetical protein TNCT_711571 [Trichonephila clavata]
MRKKVISVTEGVSFDTRDILGAFRSRKTDSAPCRARRVILSVTCLLYTLTKSLLFLVYMKIDTAALGMSPVVFSETVLSNSRGCSG